MGRKSWWVSSVVNLAFIMGSTGVAVANIIDQRNDALPPTIAWNLIPQDVGQSFTPTLTSLSWVELYMEGGHIAGRPSATVLVRIRQGSITGPILATSGSQTVSDNYFDYLHFDFATPVALTPGQPYVIQPKVTSASVSFYTDGRRQDTYSGGTAIFNVSPDQSADLMFREGIVPEPSSSAAIAIMVVAGWQLRRHRIQRGMCPECGYHLRATPRQCPECGAIAATISA